MFTVYLNGTKYSVTFHHYKVDKKVYGDITKEVDETSCKITELDKENNPVKEYKTVVNRYAGMKKADAYDRSKARKFALGKVLKQFAADDKVRVLFWTNYFLNHSYSEGKDFFHYFIYYTPTEIFKFVSDNLAGDAKETLSMIIP